jgi:hypothetical protein
MATGNEGSELLAAAFVALVARVTILFEDENLNEMSIANVLEGMGLREFAEHTDDPGQTWSDLVGDVTYMVRKARGF